MCTNSFFSLVWCCFDFTLVGAWKQWWQVAMATTEIDSG